INALPLRVQVDPARPLLPWLKALQLQTATMQQWESSPMAVVREHCEVPRHQPLFDTVLVVENYPLAEKLGQLRTRRGAVLQEFRFIESNDLPLTLAVFSGATLRINANYDTRGFTGPS